MAPSAGPASHALWSARLDVAVGSANVGPMPINSPVSFLSGQGKTATSKTDRSPNSVRVPPRELGTVTNASVGRINWLKGRNERGGMRGINGLTINWFVS